MSVIMNRRESVILSVLNDNIKYVKFSLAGCPNTLAVLSARLIRWIT